MHGVGEAEDWRSDISTGNGLPVWINHIAFGATEETQQAAKARMTAAGIEPLMEVDHGWCHSLYYVDPNGIMVEFCRDTPGVIPEPGGRPFAVHRDGSARQRQEAPVTASRPASRRSGSSTSPGGRS